MKLLIKDLVFASKSSTNDKIGGNISKISGAKSKNMIISNFLAKSKLLIKSSFRLGFSTSGTRLVFAKLR